MVIEEVLITRSPMKPSKILVTWTVMKVEIQAHQDYKDEIRKVLSAPAFLDSVDFGNRYSLSSIGNPLGRILLQGKAISNFFMQKRLELFACQSSIVNSSQVFKTKTKNSANKK